MSDKVTNLQPMPAVHVSPYRQNILEPGKPPTADDVFIPSPALQKAVQSFLMQHRMPSKSPRTPRSMLVQGLPGSGKTEIVVRSVLMMSTAVLLLAPSVFSSKHEGGGVEKVVDAMQEAERYSHANRVHVTMLFDDIDHSNLSVDDNTGKTTNVADVIGHLQSLSTNRNVHVGFTGLPVPFLATANAATKIAASLFRAQRAKVYTHVADETTKRFLARKLFPPASHEDSGRLNRLFDKYKREQPAFWTQLWSDYDAKLIELAMEATKSFDPQIVEAEAAKPRPLDLNVLAELAENCRKSKPFDFLAKLRSAS